MTVLPHSESGWATENMIIAFIHWLQSDVAEGTVDALILDAHASHRAARLLATADGLELLFARATEPACCGR
jgi:hypothetical protein